MTGRSIRMGYDAQPREIPFAGGTVCGASMHSPMRTWNEDAGLVLPLGPDRGVLAVADGAGGHEGSETAAAIALQAFEASITKSDGRLFERACQAVEAAHGAVERAEPDAGTTLACTIVSGTSFRSLHVGDSGILQLGQRGKRKFETVAHSPVGYAQEAGLITEAEALVHEDRHLVSSLLGFDDHQMEMSKKLQLARYDTLLLATDGLLDNLSVDEISDVVRGSSLVEAVTNLVAVAQMRMETPGQDHPSKPDDLTVLLYRRT